jgi:hypothetical protein
MKPSHELFKLVQSLTKSEKRFFKLTSSLQSGDKNYIKIFDYIERQDNYDEEELKEYFKNERFIAHLPSEKNHLYKLILKSLRMFYGEQSVNSQLQQEIKNVEILYQKALFGECHKIIKKSKKIAQEYEKFYYWFELIAWEKKLLEESYESGDFEFDLDQLIAEEETVIAKLRNLAEYQVLYSKINYIFRSGGFSRNDDEKAVVDGIADYHLIKGKNTALSTRATSICYYIKGLCSATNRDYQDSFVFFKRVISILDENPKIKADLTKRYLSAQAHLIRCYIDIKDFDGAMDIIETLKHAQDEPGFQSVDMQVRLYAVSTGYHLILLNAQGKFWEALGYIGETEKNHAIYADKLTKEQRLIFAYHTAYAHFGCGEYKQAMKVLNELINDNESMLRQDIYSFARVLNMFIHYELDNQSLLTYHINSTKRILSKSDRNYVIESYLIESIQKLNRIQTKSERIEHFQNMKRDIETMMKDHREKVILEYFDLGLWIESKLNGTTMHELGSLIL